MKEKAIISGRYETNWTTSKMELMKQGAPLQRGQKVYAYGYAGIVQKYAVINPDTRELVEAGDPDAVDEYSLNSYFSPLTCGDKYMKPISEKFGIGLYYAENEPLYSDDDITKFLLRADKIESLRKQRDERQAAESMAETERLKHEYDYLTIVDSRWDYKTTSGNLRKLLAHKFPGVKFSISRRSKGSDSVNIRWTDGPTDEAVSQIGKLFKGKRFDAMTDYEDIVESEFLTLFGALGYIFTNRSFSDAVLEAEKARVLEDYPQLSDGKQIRRTEISAFKNPKDLSIMYFSLESVALHRLWDADLTSKHEDRKSENPEADTAKLEGAAKTSSGLRIVDYSEKAVAIIGDTKAMKDLLKSMGGRFNARLTCGAGWVFSKKKTYELKVTLGI